LFRAATAESVRDVEAGPLIASRSAMSARYPAIAVHGIIGDLETAALVTLDGTIDFLCLPSFDSPTVFLALLDAERGGRFAVEAQVADARREQRYLRDTNVLV